MDNGKFHGRCPRCNGNILFEYGKRKCLQCGHEPKTRSEMILFYKANSDEIMADHGKLGAMATAKKWSVPLDSLYSLHSRRSKLLNAAPLVQPAPANHANTPPFPPWSNDWAPAVQILWLSLWRQLHAENRKEET